MKRVLLPLLLGLSLGQVLGGEKPPADESPPEAEALPPRKSIREAARTFALDGRYLFTFPKRTHAKGVWLTTGFVVGTALLIGRDDEIRREVDKSSRTGTGRIATKFEPLGRGGVAAAALGVAYLAGRTSGNRQVVSTSATAFEAFLWTFIVTSAAKAAFGRARPSGDADAHDFFEGDTIFPSGHTSRSFAIAAVLADRHGRVAACIAYPVAALIGLSTVQQDVHWASDILAGAGLGLAIGKGIASRHPRHGSVPAGARRMTWRLVPRPGGAIVSLAF